MTNQLMSTLLLALALAAGAGCSNKPSTDDGATKKPAPVAIDDADLTTAVDFEEAAEKSIDLTNYKAELTALEATIAKP
jgi:hypothetical protein